MAATLMLFISVMARRLAAILLALPVTGTIIAARMAMMAITVSISISVNPAWRPPVNLVFMIGNNLSLLQLPYHVLNGVFSMVKFFLSGPSEYTPTLARIPSATPPTSIFSSKLRSNKMP